MHGYRWKWLEGHVAPPPKSQFRGQGIHTAISLHDLRDASLENTSGPSFELRNSNYANSRTHKQKYRNLNDHSNFALCSRVVTSIVTCTSTTRGNTSKKKHFIPLSVTHPPSVCIKIGSRTIPHQIKIKPNHCPPGPQSLGLFPTRTTPH